MTAFHATKVDKPTLRAYRLSRVRAQLKKADCTGIILYDPVNIRYATDTSNMQVWTMHNAARYAFVAAEGPVIVFDFHGCGHLSDGIETVTEVRPAISWTFFLAGSESENRCQVWAAELASLISEHGGGNGASTRRVAADRMDPMGLYALEKLGITVVEGQPLMEQARAIKNDVELPAMMESLEACQEGMRRMRDEMRPGITETKLWSTLHQANIELGGEWIETRLLASGPRTNPWFQECSHRVLEEGDFISFDTDLVGPNGYCSDISRTWICGDKKPNDTQRRLYEIARTQIRHNIEFIKPGMGFKEFSFGSFRLPDEFIANRYSVVAHGVGLCDEWPGVMYEQDWDHGGYDGIFEPGMTLCIESLVGFEGGRECVKLEEQVLITADKAIPLSTYPFEDAWA